MGYPSIPNRLRNFGGGRDGGPRTRPHSPSRGLDQFGQFGLKSHRRARCASCRQLRDNGMASVSQLNPYQCDQCGTANIVAAPVLYQQGTHTYSTRFHSGTTQSFSAQAVTTPRPRGYLRAFLVWGPPVTIFFVWTVVGVISIHEHPMTSALRPSAVTVFLFLGAASLLGMVLSLRRIARYNREVYPRLRWNWEHTYICRRCGRFRLIPS